MRRVLSGRPASGPVRAGPGHRVPTGSAGLPLVLTGPVLTGPVVTGLVLEGLVLPGLVLAHPARAGSAPSASVLDARLRTLGRRRGLG